MYLNLQRNLPYSLTHYKEHIIVLWAGENLSGDNTCTACMWHDTSGLKALIFMTQSPFLLCRGHEVLVLSDKHWGKQGC